MNLFEEKLKEAKMAKKSYEACYVKIWTSSHAVYAKFVEIEEGLVVLEDEDPDRRVRERIYIGTGEIVAVSTYSHY